MYPLVYGRTRVLRQEVVGVADAIARWAGKGEVLPREDEAVAVTYRRPRYRRRGFQSDNVPQDFCEYRLERPLHVVNGGRGSAQSVKKPSPNFKLGSDTFQWLPSNVAFQDDGTVKFTSYVNNLHPQKYGRTYRALEQLITTSIPLWEQCLVATTLRWREITRGHGRRSARIPVRETEE